MKYLTDDPIVIVVFKVGDELIKRETVFRDHSFDPSDYVVRYRSGDPEIGYLIRR